MVCSRIIDSLPSAKTSAHSCVVVVVVVVSQVARYVSFSLALNSIAEATTPPTTDSGQQRRVVARTHAFGCYLLSPLLLTTCIPSLLLFGHDGMYKHETTRCPVTSQQGRRWWSASPDFLVHEARLTTRSDPFVVFLILSCLSARNIAPCTAHYRLQSGDEASASLTTSVSSERTKRLIEVSQSYSPV